MRFGAQVFAVSVGIQHATAGEGGAFGPVADHQPVAGPHAGRLFQAQLGQLAFARAHRFAFHQYQPRRPMAAAVMHAHAGVIAQRGAVGRQARGALENDIDRVGRLGQLGQGDGGATGQFFTGKFGKAQGGAGAGQGIVLAAMMRLHGANAAVGVRRESGDRFALFKTAAGKCAGDHGADALQRKHAIHCKAWLAVIDVRRHGVGQCGEGRLQMLQAPAGVGGHGDDGGLSQRTIFQLSTDLGFALRGLLHEIGFGERNDAAGGAKVGEDLQVLFGLRHPAVLGGHDEQCKIHRADAGDHVFDEILMARHIDDAEAVAGQFKMREAKVDGDAALFFFREPIGVVAGQGLDQCTLAVVDVTGRRKYGVAGLHYLIGNRLNSKVAFTGTDLPFTSRCGPKK